MQIKLTAVFAFVLLALLGLLLRIAYITQKSGKQYSRKVLSQQSYDSRSIPYRRGEIEDRNGITLARSERVYNLVLDCLATNTEIQITETKKEKPYVTPTIDALAQIFKLDETDLKLLLKDEATASSQYQVLLKNVTDEQKEAFEAYASGSDLATVQSGKDDLDAEERAERKKIQGVWFEPVYTRDYPYSTLASNVLGFANMHEDGSVGAAGIEEYYNSLLTGTNGRTFGYLNSDLEYEKQTIEPEHGKTLMLTLDMNIQQIVEEKIAEFDAEYGTKSTANKGAKNIGVVVMDPKSGEVLAMATNRGYDLNKPDNLSLNYTKDELNTMTDEQEAEARNQQWSNFCVSTSYEPGSVVKPLTVASALEVGAVKDGDNFYCDGGEFITDTYIKCDNVYGHGDETLEYGIVNSCNDVLMAVGAKMGIANFTEYQQLFNFGSQTGIDLPNETPGVIYSRDNMHEVELATCAFGQGFTISMVQEITAFSSVINGGYYYQPHVVKQVLSADGKVEKTVSPLVLKQPISSYNSSLIRRYLTTAVKEGTGMKSRVPGYLTGGKTGTAEKIDPTTGQRAKGKYLVSFIGACPMDDPEVVIYCIVDEPNVEEQADSSYPQYLFRSIATEVFPYLGLYPTEPVTPQLLAELGLTEDDVVQGGDTGLITFGAMDSNGKYIANAHVEDGKVVDEEGNEVAGAIINSEGNVVDGKMNVIEIHKDKKTSEVAENPNIASPPAVTDGSTSDQGTSWSGVTSQDLDEDEGSADDAGAED